MTNLERRPQEGADGVRGARQREGPSDMRWRAPLAAGLGVRRLVMTLKSGEFRGMSGTLARSPESAGCILGRNRRGLSGASRGTVRAALL